MPPEPAGERAEPFRLRVEAEVGDASGNASRDCPGSAEARGQIEAQSELVQAAFGIGRVERKRGSRTTGSDEGNAMESQTRSTS